ncbi:MAG TPA: SufD family Fe-S cluster assembly protein [Thermotogota bacterium]|nr:SufD family Fe-S cluster assembly protein [Thermotogota bacterium]HPR97216.1 SufD family Fe-S cluster assembly protein [Thermotogota bacterium]
MNEIRLKQVYNRLFEGDFEEKDTIFIDKDNVLYDIRTPGITVQSKGESNLVKLDIKVEEGVKPEKPVFLCVGFLESSGNQYIEYSFDIGKNAEVEFISHCFFPYTDVFLHTMKSEMTIGENAKVYYEDVHYHSESGNVMVESDYKIDVQKNAEIKNLFELVKTRVGKLDISMDITLHESAKGYAETKIREQKDDTCHVKEIIRLEGDHSNGMAKTFIIGEDESKAEVLNEVYGTGQYSKGHIECDEIIAGEKVVLSTIPKLLVSNNTSEITHEAAVGRVNSEQLETLMSKGLSEEEASDMIIEGILNS